MAEHADNPASPPSDERAFPLFIDSVRDYAIFMLNGAGYVETWNAGAQRIKGYTAHDIVGKHFSQFYLPADREAGVPEHNLDVATAEGRWEGEGWRLRQDGTTFWASVVITAVRDRDGTLVGFGKVTRDLTDAKIAEEERGALLAAERTARHAAETAAGRLEALQRVTEVGLQELTYDELLDALLVRVAEAVSVDVVAVRVAQGDQMVVVAAVGSDEPVERWPDMPVGQGLAGRVALEMRPLITDDLTACPTEAPALRSIGVTSVLTVPLLVHGATRGVLQVGSMRPRSFTEDEATLTQLIADRVALNMEHVRLIEAEHVARAEAATADATARLREQFLGIAAHELKTPLTVVHGYALLLQRALDRGSVQPETLATAVHEIAVQSSRLNTLINDLLATSRIHEGRLTLEREKMDLRTLAESVVKRFIDGTGASANHSLVLDAPEAVIGEWDIGRLDQVITNLVSNAIKYSPAGGEVRNTESGAELRVSDHGVGMASTEQADLFQPFSRLRSNERVAGGIGLGLFLSAQFVERHGGRISVESEAGRGSTFTVLLPREPKT